MRRHGEILEGEVGLRVQQAHEIVVGVRVVPRMADEQMVGLQRLSLGVAGVRRGFELRPMAGGYKGVEVKEKCPTSTRAGVLQKGLMFGWQGN
ncbi:hypothetical protein D3C86_1616210 [compost metagenome]